MCLELQWLIIDSAPSSSSPPVSEFLVGFQTASNSRVRKLRRDTGITSGFITPAGTVTSDCTQSDVCYINSQGQLSLVNGATYSTNTGVASEPFVPSTSPGTISTTWQLSGTVVKWNHVGFLNGTAALCLDPTSGTVQVYFTSPPPTSCISVILTSVSGEESLLSLWRDLLISCSIFMFRSPALCY